MSVTDSNGKPGPQASVAPGEATSSDEITRVAAFVHQVAGDGARVLHAGCGTGGVAKALAALGHPVLGVDSDLDQLRVAADEAPRVPFWLSDLARLDVPQAAIAGGFDAVLLGGGRVAHRRPPDLLRPDENSPDGMPDHLPRGLPGSLPDNLPDELAAVLTQLALVAKPGGAVISAVRLGGDGTASDEMHLKQYDAAALAAGLVTEQRYADWDRGPLRAGSSYAVVVHRRPENRQPDRPLARLRDRLRQRP